ncbi:MULTISPECIES: acyl-CoA dehydrogenase family protein [unclassified Streptomyces]|uniref:acyl-CoA dehydrogenase family protein n=1 Tax=unclassified Streptomyces TaxID=2593676 RepID=UPI00143B7324|nr:acyl-CoA dehydrogenase family protein [Streptomyces sp. NEAU-H3]NJA58260.1 acyl-CoA dehydrogenase [Streptomyces sp. NEAU-H3]
MDTTDLADSPTRADLVARAARLVPTLRENAAWGEENRQLHEGTVKAMAEAGLLRTRLPARLGGYESDMRTQVEVLAELARGDGSASWTAGVWSISAWVAGLFPDAVQDEVFASPDDLVSGIISATAMAVPAEGGIVVNGRWSFNSGAKQSRWNTNAAVLAMPDGSHQPVMTLIPLASLEIVDDWHTAGLRGSGSVSTVAHDVFVPEGWYIPLGGILQGHSGHGSNADALIHRAPIMPTACATVSATALGLAKGARDVFFERLPGRKITYTEYTDQSQAPLTHLQVAEASVKIDESEFHVHRIADLVDSKNASGEPWTLEERARVRLDTGAASLRSKEAVDILNTASGASSVYTHVPIQRIERDVQTLNLHAIMHPNTNLELYGRILCGLAPNTQYL